MFGKGFTGAGGINVAVLALVLASSQSAILHLWGTVAAWVIFLQLWDCGDGGLFCEIR